MVDDHLRTCVTSAACHNSHRFSVRKAVIRTVRRYHYSVVCQSFFGIQTFYTAVLQFHRGN